ncbi:unnamed protein product [Symbiodinium sp. CCMP2592]|nr:unnamed protein product [Symbiodinium sp. CCMP2592]
MLTVILLPWTWYLTRCLLFPRPPPELDFETGGLKSEDSRVKLCGTSLMQARRHNAQQIAKRRRFRGIIKVQLVGAAIGWAFLFWVLWELKARRSDASCKEKCSHARVRHRRRVKISTSLSLILQRKPPTGISTNSVTAAARPCYPSMLLCSQCSDAGRTHRAANFRPLRHPGGSPSPVIGLLTFALKISFSLFLLLRVLGAI